MNLNKVMLIGRITADPQMRSTPGGQNVTSFSMATNRSYSSKGGDKKQDVEFHNCVAWGKAAELICQYVKKGSMLYVCGRLQTRGWEKNGVKHKTTEIIVTDFQFGPKAAGTAAARPTAEAEDPFGDVPMIELEDDIKPEDLPFG